MSSMSRILKGVTDYCPDRTDLSGWQVYEKFALGLGLTLLIFYFHPYHGIRHDSVLYLGQALYARHPEIYGEDLFFAYGSQAKFTIFPAVIGWLLDYFTPAALFMTLTAATLVFFTLASAFLLRWLLPPGWRTLGLIALLILPAGYGGLAVFSYLEPFFTGRGIAESLVLIALAGWFGGRRPLLVGSAFLAAGLIHPLQTLPAATVIGLDLLRRHPRIGLGVVTFGAVCILALAVVGVPPFQDLLRTQDLEWRQALKDANPHLFVAEWSFRDATKLIVDLILSLVLLREAKLASLHRMFWSVLLATTLSVLVTLLGADLLGAVLITNLQLWRVHWLLHWTVVAALPWLLASVWQDGAWDSIRFWWLLAILALVQLPLGNATATVALLMLGGYLLWPRVANSFPPRSRSLLLWGLRVISIAVLIAGAALAWRVYQSAGQDNEVARLDFLLLQMPLWAPLVIWAGFQAWRKWSAAHPLLLGLLVLALVHAGMQWDRRSPWTRHIEAAEFKHEVFGVQLPVQKQIFWQDDPLAPWLIFERPSYFSNHQLAGQNFNRETAMEGLRREKVIRLLEFQQQICALYSVANGNSCELSREAVTESCQKAAGVLEYLVLQHPVEGVLPLGVWALPKALRGKVDIHYYLYACADFLR
jgi:hypothetical protein